MKSVFCFSFLALPTCARLIRQCFHFSFTLCVNEIFHSLSAFFHPLSQRSFGYAHVSEALLWVGCCIVTSQHSRATTPEACHKQELEAEAHSQQTNDEELDV